ncbi:glutarate dioxygenase GlaH [Cupriavidus pinatubonensis]|uniref:glutarate dioxygenase GlaH n=1 Tax=Cupriavidus pinatubonensis TaxID=248026 RepID=UPI00112E4A7A|nr:glutarate dioxygenase GlaH [Cupriavidus pinatubonensis]TPQ32322.1 protein CsiD [Cupriavidus pinatubonensis]
MNAPLPAALLAANDQPRFQLSAHPGHHRIVHVTIERGALLAFLEEVRKIDVQNLEYVPFMRYELASTLARHVGEDFAATVNSIVKDRHHGGFTAGLQDLTSDADDFVRFGTAIGHLLGPGNHDAMSGTYYARFVVKHTDNSDSYLRQAYRLFTMHTDGTFVSEATDWLLMMKFAERNAVGGESRFLHLDDWEDINRFVSHRLGTKPFVYKAPGSKNVSDTVERPVFFQNEFGLSMSFIDQFVQPRNREEAAFLNDLSTSMEASPGTKEVSLPVGDLVVLNNYIYVHGRAPFEKSPLLFRELMRQRGTFA